jgi:hypothetical protein
MKAFFETRESYLLSRLVFSGIFFSLKGKALLKAVKYLNRLAPATNMNIKANARYKIEKKKKI